ncbi:MAG: hypothetical protein V3W18_06880 [candidate division Zixibacteria bacterium]
MMMTAKITKSIFAAFLSIFLLAGPVAFQQGCTMVGCSCQPEEAPELAFDKARCCCCGTMEQAPAPIQPVAETMISKPENLRPEFDIISAEVVELINKIDGAFGLVQTNSLSPPFIESHISAPLIC